MVDNIAKVAYGIILIMFLLSVIAPKESQNRFWRVIHKIREGMDRTAGWIFKLYLILLIVFVVYTNVYNWITAHGLLK